MSGVSFAHQYFLNKHGDLSFKLYFFETDIGRGHLGKVFKKISVAFFFSEESP